MTNLIRTLLLAAGACFLVGCGGGGGDDPPPAPPAPPPATEATITTANAPTIASAVMTASILGADLGGFVSPVANVGGQKTSQSKLAYAKAAGISSGRPDVLAGLGLLAGSQEPIGPETNACPGGGTLTVSGNVAAPPGFTANDNLVFDFDACVEADATIDGIYSMTVTSFSGDLESGVFTIGVRVDLTAFQVTIGTETATANGSVSIAMSAATGSVTIAITSDSLSVSEGGASHTLSDYSYNVALAGETFTLDISGTLTSTLFGGSVTFETITSLQSLGGDFAYEGTVLIAGANGATIRMTALDQDLVRLEVDTNGDGTVDATLDRAWEELT